MSDEIQREATLQDLEVVRDVILGGVHKLLPHLLQLQGLLQEAYRIGIEDDWVQGLFAPTAMLTSNSTAALTDWGGTVDRMRLN